jgi:hypothetical protein
VTAAGWWKRAALAVALAAGCGGESDGGGDDDVGGPDAGGATEPAAEVAEAMAQFPTVFEVQDALLTGTCSPNPGVCHQSEQYPELHTLGSLLDAIDAPCNVDHPVPVDGWDECERRPDLVRAGEFESDIAWLENNGPGSWTIAVRDAMPAELEGTFQLVTADDVVMFEAPDGWTVTATRAEERALSLVIDADEAIDLAVADSAIAAVIGGDLNRNGTFGADETGSAPAAIIKPGDLDNSYLWRRLMGDVPGSRMPLANGPVTPVEFVALGCWIETVATGADTDPYAPIDYRRCSFFADVPEFPTDF